MMCRMLSTIYQSLSTNRGDENHNDDTIMLHREFGIVKTRNTDQFHNDHLLVCMLS